MILHWLSNKIQVLSLAWSGLPSSPTAASPGLSALVDLLLFHTAKMFFPPTSAVSTPAHYAKPGWEAPSAPCPTAYPASLCLAQNTHVSLELLLHLWHCRF